MKYKEQLQFPLLS